MILLDGKKLAQKTRKNLKEQVSRMREKPVLAMVMVGDNSASQIYVRNKRKACDEIGIIPREISLPENTSQKEVIAQIKNLNNDENINAIMLQLPMPRHIDRYTVLAEIKPEKDADCLSPLNFGSFFQKGEADFPIGPATPVGIVRLLEEHGVPLEKKCAVLIGYSDIVGKPLSELLLLRGATVTVCHQKTQDLKSFTKKADILVSATGVKHIVTEDMVKYGAAVVDVGINREGKKIFGDVDFEKVSRRASFITPVPGGVGPMTVAILLENVVRLADIQSKTSAEKTLAKEKDFGVSDSIGEEFSLLIKRFESQCSTINDLKSRIAKAETKHEMAKKTRREALTSVEKILEEIITKKNSAWMEQKEDYARELADILQDEKSRVAKKIRSISDYNLEVDENQLKPLIKTEKFTIPTAYDDNYDLCKNAVENEIEENEKDIKKLEAQDRELENSIANMENDISGVLKKIEQWQIWLDTANEFDVNYEEDADDLYLAAVKYFEAERVAFQSEFKM